MNFTVVTLFPEFFEGPLGVSIIKRARAKGLVDFRLVNLRDYTDDPHRTVDDYPYGGGCGMVMMPGPVKLALDDFARRAPEGAKRRTIYLTPQGRPLKQKHVDPIRSYDEVLLFCGHYEDVDQRARALFDEEISIGDYVLSGGEIGALAIIDAVVRRIPGALGNPQSSTADSFTVHENLFDHPHYTRPPVWEGKSVPEVLLNGNHKSIETYRRARAMINTMRVRPDLLSLKDLTKEDYKTMREYFRWYHHFED